MRFRTSTLTLSMSIFVLGVSTFIYMGGKNQEIGDINKSHAEFTLMQEDQLTQIKKLLDNESILKEDWKMRSQRANYQMNLLQDVIKKLEEKECPLIETIGFVPVEKKSLNA